MDVIAVLMEVRVQAREIQAAQHDQHDPDRQLERQSDAGGNDPPQQNDPAPDDHDSEGVPHPPHRADQGGTPCPPDPRHDGRNGDDVIGIGGVPHPQEKAEDGDRR